MTSGLAPVVADLENACNGQSGRFGDLFTGIALLESLPDFGAQLGVGGVVGGESAFTQPSGSADDGELIHSRECSTLEMCIVARYNNGMAIATASRGFEHVTTTVIIANSAVMLLALLDHRDEELLEKVDLFFLWFFAAELTARLWTARLGFFRSRWNTADAIIIALALMPIAGGGIAVLRLARIARASHLLKHLTQLRRLVSP